MPVQGYGRQCEEYLSVPRDFAMSERCDGFASSAVSDEIAKAVYKKRVRL